MRKLLLAALALGVGSHGVAAPLPDAVPIEVFAALPAIEGPELSPDGTKVAAKIAVGGRQALIVRSLFGEGKPHALSDDRVDINWWHWVNDGWLVVGTGDEQTVYEEDVYVTRAVGVSADMTKIKPVDPMRSGIDADDVIWIADDGSARLLLSRETGIRDASEWYPSVFTVDVSTGKAKSVVASVAGVWDWDADAAGVVRYGVIYSDEGKKRGVLYRGPEGGRFQA
jgi:hypothetical protein